MDSCNIIPAAGNPDISAVSRRDCDLNDRSWQDNRNQRGIAELVQSIPRCDPDISLPVFEYGNAVIGTQAVF